MLTDVFERRRSLACAESLAGIRLHPSGTEELLYHAVGSELLHKDPQSKHFCSRNDDQAGSVTKISNFERLG